MFKQATSSLPRTLARSSVSRCAGQNQIRRASGGSAYNQPTGHLFGEKPPAKGQKRQKEGWENIWYFGMFGGMALGLVITLYKPDTTIQTWALAEARKRLDESGEPWQYQPSVNSDYPKGV